MTTAAKTILIAEDDENDILLLRRAFEESGIKNPLVITYDGYQVVDYLEGQPPYTDRKRYPIPGLIILDIKMRLMDGFEVLAWMRTRPQLKDLPAVVLTGSDDQGDQRQAAGLGAADYRVKPQRSTELAGILRQWHKNFLSSRRPKQELETAYGNRSLSRVKRKVLAEVVV